MQEYENFIAVARESGTGSKEITIPSRIVQFLGIESGDEVRVMIKKIVKEE